MAMGNVIGSNIANVGLIAGLAALASPIDVSKALRLREAPIMLGALVVFTLFIAGGVAVISPITFAERLVTIDAPTMFGLSALLWLMMLTRWRIERWEGAALVILYGAYLWVGVIR